MAHIIEVPSSKSLLIRLLFIESMSKSPLLFYGSNVCDDVQLTRAALNVLKSGGHEFNCGASGALFRFLALRVSRETGQFVLRGTPRLMERGHSPLLSVLEQLGVEAHLDKKLLKINSRGWNNPSISLAVDMSASSQIMSGLLMSSINLPFSLRIQVSKEAVSKSYLFMTLELLKFFQIPIIKVDENVVEIPAHATVKQLSKYFVEPDMSSAFSVAAYAALNMNILISHFPNTSLQGDFVFPAILKRMGVKLERIKENLCVYGPSSQLAGTNLDLSSTPDLFPVLATLCAFAKSSSHFTGISHLKFKESNRVHKTLELIKILGCGFSLENNQIKLFPSNRLSWSTDQVVYDCENDHRLAMAASLLISRKINLTIKNPECVSKSYPSYWKDVGLETITE